MTEQEKMELVVVDTFTCTLYDFTASSWRGPRTPEEVLKAAQDSAADDVRRYENILNSGRYDDRKEYWTECLEAAKARTFSTMTYGDFLNAQRERLLSDPMPTTASTKHLTIAPASRKRPETGLKTAMLSPAVPRFRSTAVLSRPMSCKTAMRPSSE